MKTVQNLSIMKNELESLSNCISSYKLTGFTIHEYFQQDKRKTKPLYFLADGKGNTLTGYWEFSQLNYFIMGCGKAIKFRQNIMFELAYKEYPEDLHKWADNPPQYVDINRAHRDIWISGYKAALQ